MWNLFGKPTPQPTPTTEKPAPRPDYGDTYHFEDIGVACERSEEYIWTEYGPRRNTPPLDPPPSIQKDLYDAKCGAIKLTNPLGETAWQPTVGCIELWGTDVPRLPKGHLDTIRLIFDGASITEDADRHICETQEQAIRQAESMKQILIDKHKELLRQQWRPAQ